MYLSTDQVRFSSRCSYRSHRPLAGLMVDPPVLHLQHPRYCRPISADGVAGLDLSSHYHHLNWMPARRG